ncbi:MAG: DNA polymerase, partial [Nanoarchaeota archaeon]
LAASSEDGTQKWSLKRNSGIKTEEALDFILDLPGKPYGIFAYSFNYDLTKILDDIDNKNLYLLFRPQLRKRKGKDPTFGPKPIEWNDYLINLQGTKFTVQKHDKKIIIWDIWKFFQSPFIAALKEWKVGDSQVLENMQYMKDHRSEFDKLSPERIESYCFDECAYMAELANKLYTAHQKAGLDLKNFYGAGSSASAMLKKMEIKEKIHPCPKELELPVASAYFGGRFECSITGEIKGPVYNYDISSAYPYQTYFLPCLIHGKWKHTKNEYDINPNKFCKHAIVKYKLIDYPNRSIKSWAPFPFRAPDGNICYPLTSGGGWLWRDEFLAGQKLFANVEFLEAYVLESGCNCKPFEQIAEYYIERLKIGKEGPGIAIKLGINSCYGKLAQSVGQGQYTSWIWAGMITSGCRAQLLEVLGLHKYRHNSLAMATDGVYSREKLILPTPKNTNTNTSITDLSGKTVCKPLGGWETKKNDKGLFMIRPGMNFPIAATIEDIQVVRGRGVGRKTLFENIQKIQNSF